MDKTTQLEKTVKNRQKGPVLTSKGAFYSFFLWITHFFYSFNNSFNRTAKIFIQRIYSLKKDPKLSIQRIHSFKKDPKLFIQRIYSFKKNPKLFIQRKYSFKWKMYYRPGLHQPYITNLCIFDNFDDYNWNLLIKLVSELQSITEHCNALINQSIALL